MGILKVGMWLGTKGCTGIRKIGYVVGELLRLLLGLGVAMPGHVTVVRERLDRSDATTSEGKGIPIPASLNSSTHAPVHSCTGMGPVELGAEL